MSVLALCGRACAHPLVGHNRMTVSCAYAAPYTAFTINDNEIGPSATYAPYKYVRPSRMCAHRTTTTTTRQPMHRAAIATHAIMLSARSYGVNMCVCVCVCGRWNIVIVWGGWGGGGGEHRCVLREICARSCGIRNSANRASTSARKSTHIRTTRVAPHTHRSPDRCGVGGGRRARPS